MLNKNLMGGGGDFHGGGGRGGAFCIRVFRAK